MRYIVCGLLIVLSLSSARADMGFNIGPRVTLEAELRFMNLDEYPDYDFYLKYGSSQGNPYAGLTLQTIPSNGTISFKAPGRRITQLYLVAVPKKAPAPTAPKEWDNNWLTKPPQDGQQILIIVKPGEPLSEQHQNYELKYQVKLTDKQMELVCVEAIQPYRWTPWVGLAMTFPIIFGGYFFIRWLQNRHDRRTPIPPSRS